MKKRLTRLMKSSVRSVIATVAVAGVILSFVPGEALAEKQQLNDGWHFFNGDSEGAEQPEYDDSHWRQVMVPHDWSIMDRPGTQSPFVATAQNGQDSGYLAGGTGWYRKSIHFTEKQAKSTVKLNFGAVYMDAEIWLNGKLLDEHHYGYTAFTVDLTGKLHSGRNLIAVKVQHDDPSSRWYAGSGILQPVSLEILDCVYIDPDSIFVSTPLASDKLSTVKVSAQINACGSPPRKVSLSSRILNNAGVTVAFAAKKSQRLTGSTTSWDQSFSIENPALWSLEEPNLYTLVQKLTVDGHVVDTRHTRFGIRQITFDAKNGLQLNGKSILMRGGNIHHDHYMLGAAGFPDADARKVRLMKAAGYNAIRSSHNPASKATLEAADELGMLVINEAFDSWNVSKRAHDYSRFFANDWKSDIESMVVSARNHPSVVFWSIGNEIPEQGTPQGIETGKALAEYVRSLDPTRPVTQAVSIDPPASAKQYATLDVAGYNYRSHLFASDHTTHSQRVMYSSESLPGNAFEVWQTVESMPWVIGDFVWTAVDYLGEAGIGWMGYSQDWQKLGPYPWHLAYCGEIDATGRKRSAAYYREVIWKSGLNPLSMFVQQPSGSVDLPDRHYYEIEPPHLDWSLADVHPSWSWPGHEQQPLTVVVYSEYPEVELFLNDQSLGSKSVSAATAYMASFTVPYTPGSLKAVASNNKGQRIATWELRTAGVAATATVQVDKTSLHANGQDLAYVTIELKDRNGIPIYHQAQDRYVTVEAEGQGEVVGIGNGNPIDVSSFQAGRRKTFHGRVVAVVRAGTAPGPLTIKVTVEGQQMQKQTLYVLPNVQH